MFAPFPRTSVYPSLHPHFQKHNKRLGKVSHQMQKIIEDIQGKRPEKSDSRKSDSQVSNERPDTNKNGVSDSRRRSQRRKSRKYRESDEEQREMACQTTMIETVENRSVASDNCRKQKLQTETEIYPGNLTGVHNKSNSLDRNFRPTDENFRKHTKRSKVEDKLSKVKMAPWERPLPPVPGNPDKNAVSQALIYQKVFDALHPRMKVTPQKGGKSDPVNFSPVKSLSKQIEERNVINVVSRSRYVDIDIMSSERNWKSGDRENVENSRGTTQHRASDGEDNDEHIYETIDENDNYESIKDFKSRELFPNTPVPVSPAFHLLTPDQTPFRSFRGFRHEDTYLEPVCSLDDLNCEVNIHELSEERHPGCQDQITDFPEYARDFASSPTNSTVSEESLSLRATYV